MQKRLSVLLSAAVVLSACSGGEQQTSRLTPQSQASLVYSYPLTEQQEVPTHAPVVLRFSEPLLMDDPASHLVLRDQNGVATAYTAALVDDNRGLVLTPEAPLAPNTRYTLEATDLVTASGAIAWAEPVGFTTRSAVEGTRAQVSKGEFAVSRLIPDGSQLPLMDFSTLRLQFTQPLDVNSVRYGETLALLDASGEPVAASVIVQGPYLSIDPVEDLQAGASYQLKLDSSLTSRLGDTLTPGDYAELTLTPKDSHPRETMVQHAGDSVDGSLLSVLTGSAINAVPVKALLLGDQSVSQQQGDVRAELAFIPNYPEVTPLRINRSSLLIGSSVTVDIGGHVPAGFETGDIAITFISDANGYLMPNQYSRDEAAPRHIRLFLDLAMTAENEKANGALSQDLLHVELVGTAIVQNGIMVIDAVGVVEPRVLGLDQAYGTLSFHMEAYRDQINAPALNVDNIAPVIQSWVPGPNHHDKHRPGDPIVINFDEPVDRNSLAQEGAWNLYAGNTLVSRENINWHLDGSSLVIKPKTDLQFGATYRVELTGLITDLSDNALENTTIEFSMPRALTSNPRAPLALTVYPGYPCVTAAGRNLASDIQGRCSGGATGDDLIPVSKMPADRPIVVRFSQNLKKSNVQLATSCNEAKSFRVERVDTNGACLGTVAGHLEVNARDLSFTPEQPWQEGQLYRYVLGSTTSGITNCSNGRSICSESNHPLQTAFLEKPNATAGGPNMELYFKGAPAVKTVFNPLWNLPTLDVNANMRDYKEESEVAPVVNGERRENTTYLYSTNDHARIGCDQSGWFGAVKPDCPDKKFLVLTANLDTEVIGYDESEDAIHVKLYPSTIITSSIDVYAKALGIELSANPTGPQMMRMRYQKDTAGKRVELIDGYIRETEDGPIFTTQVDLYLDAPYLTPPLGLSHNLHSYELNLNFSSPITFFDDGRMQIEQRNIEAAPITVQIGSLLTLDLAIPANGVFLNYMSRIIKK